VRASLVLITALAACAPPASAPQLDLRGARLHDLGSCRLENGATIQPCRIGYRTFGTLSADRSNLVLFPTWFSGTTADLAFVPKDLVDTDRYFLVLVDALGNGISSSPSNSETQPRLRFPKFNVRDMVEAERRLVKEAFGVEKIHAVMGISMGGMQAFEWAVSHPEAVSRFVSIVGTPQLTSTDLLLWNAELDLLEDSSTYARGEYRGRPAIRALREMHWLMLTTPKHRDAETSRAAFEGWRAKEGSDVSFDWNDWHRQLEAMIAHDVARGGDLEGAAKRVRAKGLVIVADHDQMVDPAPSKRFAEAMGATLIASDSPCGHMLPGCDPSLAPRIRAFLSE
jgi:homoserine O-acetyltransferase/O-succinyltransferase